MTAARDIAQEVAITGELLLGDNGLPESEPVVAGIFEAFFRGVPRQQHLNLNKSSQRQPGKHNGKPNDLLRQRPARPDHRR